MSKHTPYQRRVIKRYYANEDAIRRTRLAELVGELYLAEGKKRERLWKSAAEMLEKLGIPRSRIDHLLARRDAALLAEVVRELEAG